MNAETSAMWLDTARSLWPVFAVAAAVLGTVGYASARSLRDLPDFPEKAEFLRGAHWFWLWVIASYMVPFALLALVTTYTPFVSSGVMVCLGLTYWLHSLGERLFPGLVEGGGFFLWSSRLGSRRFDLAKWLAEREQGRAKQQRYERIVRIFQTCVLALCLGGAAWTFVTMDQRIFIPLWQDERLGRQLQRDLAAPEVEKVLAMQHMFQGPLYPLAIQVRPGTTPARGQELVARMRQVLAGRQDRQMWRIYARPEHGRKLAQGYYVPEGMTLPPNADRVHAQPRR